MRRFTVTTIAAQLFLYGSATPLWAQPAGGSTTSASRIELAAGHQAQRLGVTEGRGLLKGGWVEAAGTGSKARVLQVGVSRDSDRYSYDVGQYGYSGRSTQTITRAMAGTRWTQQSGSVRPYGQVLVGLGRVGNSSTFTRTTPSGTTSHQSSNASTYLAAQVGFGLNIRATNRVRVRLAADYVKPLHFHPGSWDPRFGFLYGSAGVVVGLGSR